MCFKKKQEEVEKAQRDDYGTIVSLMEIYQEEWIYRDTSFWSHAFKFFYASLVVTLLPQIAEVVHQNALDKIGIDKKWYPIAGLVLAVLFILMALQDAKRAKAAYLSYDRVMRALPNNWGRKTLTEISLKCVGKIYNIRLGLFACWIMFGGLVALGIISLSS